MTDILYDIKNIMEYNNQRHLINARNISKADIPGEKAFTLPGIEKLDIRHQPINLTATQVSHIYKQKPLINVKPIKKNIPSSLSGNNIDLMEELREMSTISNDTKIAIEAYKKIASLEKLSIYSK